MAVPERERGSQLGTVALRMTPHTWGGSGVFRVGSPIASMGWFVRHVSGEMSRVIECRRAGLAVGGNEGCGGSARAVVVRAHVWLCAIVGLGGCCRVTECVYMVEETNG